MRVLMVDNDSLERERLRRIFVSSPFEVIQASNGQEALEILETQTVDAIVSDILMPQMDGYRLCIEVRERERLVSVPFILHTNMYTSESDEKKALSLGANRFVRKSATESELLKTLSELPGAPVVSQPG
ncbi:MAG: response regulator [Leptospirales bacterium]|nr:response regulator [Leptospirales bacterium]